MDLKSIFFLKSPGATVFYFYAQRVAALRRKGDGKGR
jgi:hypothetical protein